MRLNLPAYGSPEWQQLDRDDPRRAAAIVFAAECWRRYWTPDMVTDRAEQFETEIAARLREAAHAISAGQNWVRVANAPSYAELQRRRAQPGPVQPKADAAAVAEWVRTGTTPTRRETAA